MWDFNSDNYHAKWWKGVKRIIIFNLFDRLIDKIDLNWLMHSEGDESFALLLSSLSFTILLSLDWKRTRTHWFLPSNRKSFLFIFFWFAVDRERFIEFLLTVCWPSAYNGLFVCRFGNRNVIATISMHIFSIYQK